MARFEIVANPQGAEADVFPEMVVEESADRQSAARRAWDLQMKTKPDSCLYGIREVPKKEETAS